MRVTIFLERRRRSRHRAQWYHRRARMPRCARLAPRATIAATMLYPLFRPLLFALDPEAAHHAAFASLDVAARLGVAQIALPAVAAVAGDGDGARVSQPDRRRRRARQERRAHRRARRARLRLHRVRHRHAARAAGQSEAAAVPPRRSGGADQPPRLQQRRRRARSSPTPSARAVRRHPRPQHRQELRHAERARGRRLPRLPARRLRARLVRHRQHLVARTPRACASCSTTRALAALLDGAQARAGEARAAARQVHADRRQDRARPRRRRRSRASRGCWSSTRSTA